MENLPLAVTGYEISLWIHVTAVVVGLGMTFADAVLFPVAMKLDPRHLPYVHKLQLTINQKFATPALLLILITGVYQVHDAGWGFGTFWVSASLMIVLLIGGLQGAYFIPSDRKLGAMITDEIKAAGDGPFTPSEEYQHEARIQGIIGTVTGVLILIAIYLMVFKPGA
ncbi:MAG: hypothetical protein QG596_916 [Actinomycetota bacterium]|jgi:uncharacterized membrane protein|nr:hypothetical protein [Actinomycetota bacterium]